MAKFYGDIPCVKINGKIHITVGGTKCLCVRYGLQQGNNVIKKYHLENIQCCDLQWMPEKIYER